MIRSLILMVFLASPLAAQTLMTAAEFEAYTTGKTLYYGQNGRAYGAEQYFSNRRVQWSFLDGECKEGEWYESGALICFVYDDNPDPQCWSFIEGANGLIARFENRTDTTELYEASDIGVELMCLGPEVGVKYAPVPGR